MARTNGTAARDRGRCPAVADFRYVYQTPERGRSRAACRGAIAWLIKFMKTLELPGIKVEFRDQLERVTERAKDAGLLSEPVSKTEQRPTYEVVYNTDPTLALAGLRIELERLLSELAVVAGLGKPRGGIGHQINLLQIGECSTKIRPA